MPAKKRKGVGKNPTKQPKVNKGEEGKLKQLSLEQVRDYIKGK